MFKKIPFQQSQPILQRFELSEEAAACISGEMAPSLVIDTLKENKLFIDLVNFISHALPAREGIWWACLALDLRKDDWNNEEQKVVADSKRWVQEPDEAKRRLAEMQVAKLGLQCATGWLAQAVFWNGSGSLGEPGQPVVLPPEFLYAKATAGAVNTAAVIPEWAGYDNYCEQVTAMAIDIANGGRGDRVAG